MKKKEIFLNTIIMLLLSLATIQIVVSSLTGTSIVAMAKARFAKPQPVQITAMCSNLPALPNLQSAADPQVQKLAEYQSVCGSQVTDTLMIITTLPQDTASATQQANTMAAQLKEFNNDGIKPIVLVEPNSNAGFDVQKFESGEDDAVLKAYFAQLRAQGITDSLMGTWVPFPNANLPTINHHNIGPDDFGQVVTRYINLLKAQFPQAHTSLLLNSATYETDNFSWANGQYDSLVPYVKGIRKGLVDSFGLQGFPWMPPATTPGPGMTDAGDYLNYHLASDAAETLGVRTIWLNTGSFSRSYTNNSSQIVILSPEQRKAILDGAVSQAAILRDKGYTVSINLMAQDKSATSDATDWSYWQSNAVTTSPDATVFTNFVSRLQREHIGLSLYDTK